MVDHLTAVMMESVEKTVSSTTICATTGQNFSPTPLGGVFAVLAFEPLVQPLLWL